MSQSFLQLQQVFYSAGAKCILESIQLAIRPGKVTAILGPNGSGKSSLLKLLAGLTVPDHGNVFLGNQLLNQIKKPELAKRLTLLPQHSPLPLGMTVYDLVACGRHPYSGLFGRLNADDKRAIERALQRVDMSHYHNQRIDHLSGGEMQRVWLAMVLAQETGILLLDEPTSWLDIAHQLKLLEIVRTLNIQQGTTIVWVLHDLNQALQYSDDIVLMNHGRVVRAGAAEEVLNQEVIGDVFGVQTEKVRVNSSGQTLFVPLGTEHQEGKMLIREVA